MSKQTVHETAIRRHSSPGKVESGLLGIPFIGGFRNPRRPTIFTIGEGLEFDEDDNEEAREKRDSLVYSSNSSLESGAGETWGARSRRRLSIPSPSMGLQAWVEKQNEEGRRSSFSLMNKKRKSYEEIKTLVNTGKYNEAKCSVRDGDWDFGHDIRTRLWPFLDTIHETTFSTGNDSASSNKMQQQGLTDYWENVKELFGDSKSAQDLSNIPLTPIGLPAPCPSSSGIYYKLDETGKMICNRVCSIICYTFADITYCPLLCPIVALFLHYVEEEKAYTCVCNLISAKHKVFLTQTKVQWDVCSRTALALTRKYSKSTYAALVKNLPSNEKLETIFQDWAWWIFRDLPMQHLVRIIDCFLMEGIKVLYRITIGILINFTKTMPFSGDNFGAAISEHCKRLEIPPTRLLKSAFSIRNFRSNEIRRVTTKVQFEIKGSVGDSKGGQSPFPRSKSGDSMPTSRSQVEICKHSHTMKVPELLTIWSWLPIRITMYQPELIYTTEEHGSSVTTFFNRVENYEPTLMIIKSTKGDIFGAYLSTAWSVRNEKDQRGERQRYFGTGETFLFTLVPETKRYPWVGIKEKVEHAKELFMHADTNMICIGGGEGTGIQIDSDLRYGKSERCLTFDNEPLVGNYRNQDEINGDNLGSGGDFEIQVLEVFGFTVV